MLLMLPLASLAGGTEWSVRVLGVDARPGGLNLITLEVLEDHGPGENCARILIQSRLVPEPFWHQQTWSEYAGTPREYRRALDALIVAARTGQPIYFGEMGAGLSHTQLPCVFDSRGLMLESEGHVISFHGRV